MSVIVCGSIAYDYILKFNGEFSHYLLPGKTDDLSVSFYTPEMRKEFGGTAGNIAYSMKLLGLSPKIIATVGNDFSLYQSHLETLGIDTNGIAIKPEAYCAQCFLTTDNVGNQINSFHPGAMTHAAENEVPAGDWQLGLVGPDAPDAMVAHSNRLKWLDVPQIFDPGQALPALSKENIETLIANADYVICNHYESELMMDAIQRPMEMLAKDKNAVIVTNGEHGSTILHDGDVTSIAPVKVDNAVDPTGCGDAYRAGLIYGILYGLSWEETGKVAGLCGAYQVEKHGTQNYHFTLDEFREKLARI